MKNISKLNNQQTNKPTMTNCKKEYKYKYKYPNLIFFFIFDSSFTKFFNISGIVLWPFVFISTKKEKTTKRTFKHELIHVDQVRREGPIKFYSKYLYYIYKSYKENGNFNTAFLDNEYEEEAYKRETHPLTKRELLMINSTYK